MEIKTGDIITGRYKLLQKLGDGGMGDVFLAEDLQLARQVAIKTIRHELKENVEVRQRVDRECNLHATLGVHPNIVALHDRLEDNDNIFLVMEYVPGETASAIMAQKKADDERLPVDQAISITQQTLEALAYIHENDIIHRDIKPSNILLKKTDDGYVAKLMDFGIAYLEHNDEELTRLTTLMTGGPGTPAYMAPERIDAETFGEQSPATDLYSVGIILYELLGGNPPFQGSMTEIFTGHLAKPPDFTAITDDAPPALLQILKKSLKKKKEERYQDARTFLNELKSVDLLQGDGDRTVLSTEDSTLDKTLIATGREKAALSETILAAKEASAKKEKNKLPLLVSLTAALLLVGVAVAAYWFVTDKVELAPPQDSIAEKQPGERKKSLPAPGEPNMNQSVVHPPTTTQPLSENTSSIQAGQGIDPSSVKVLDLEPPVSEAPAQDASATYLDRPGISYHDDDTKKGSSNALEAFNAARKDKQKTTQVAAAPKQRSKPKSENKTTSSSSSSTSSSGGWKVIQSTTRKISD